MGAPRHATCSSASCGVTTATLMRVASLMATSRDFTSDPMPIFRPERRPPPNRDHHHHHHHHHRRDHAHLPIRAQGTSETGHASWVIVDDGCCARLPLTWALAGLEGGAADAWNISKSSYHVRLQDHTHRNTCRCRSCLCFSCRICFAEICRCRSSDTWAWYRSVRPRTPWSRRKRPRSPRLRCHHTCPRSPRLRCHHTCPRSRIGRSRSKYCRERRRRDRRKRSRSPRLRSRRRLRGSPFSGTAGRRRCRHP